MKIWIHLGGAQQGPYDLSQLQQLPIDATTPVWYDGLPDWTAAGTAPATAHLFAQHTATPPPPPGGSPAPQPQYIYVQQPQYVQAPPRPSTYTGWAILLTILCCSPIALAAIITGTISSSHYNSADYQGAQRWSNATEWLLIFAIVFAFLTLPLGLAWWI